MDRMSRARERRRRTLAPPWDRSPWVPLGHRGGPSGLQVSFPVPFTWTPRFRLLIGSAVLVLALLAVLLFEMGPRLAPRERKPLREAAASTPEAPPLIFDGLLSRVRDSTPLGEEDEAYQRVLSAILGAGKGNYPGPGKRLGFARLLEAPGRFRGRVARITALYVHCDPQRLEKPRGDHEWIYRTWLVDPSGAEGYVIDLLDRPRMALRTLVSADAVFLKIAAYPGVKGTVRAPFFLGWEVVPHDPGRR